MTYEWIVPAAALLVYAVLLIIIFIRRDWRDAPVRRLVFYLLMAMIAQVAFLLLLGDDLANSASPLFRVYLYARVALPLFFYSMARAFIRVERRPWAFLAGVVVLAIIVAVDLLNLSLDLVSGVISTATLVLILRTVMWAFFAAFVVVFGAAELSRTTSPLHRNRLAYLAIALPCFVAYDALDLMLGEPAAAYAPALQIVGVLVFAYAAMRHDLIDLRDLLRRSARTFLVAAFAILVYTSVIATALALLRGADVSSGIFGALIAATALTLFYQPLRDSVQRQIELLFFGRRYDVRAVVQSFSQQLTAQIELDELATTGRTLLRQAMGSRDAALLLVSKTEDGYSLRVVPTPADGAVTISLMGNTSLAHALASRHKPLLQYDIDRLPQYADLSQETRDALQHLHGEVLVPIQSRGALIGVWMVGAKSSGDRYSDSDLTLLSTLAGQSAVALENARLLSDLRDQMLRMSSMRDYLDSTLASIATGVITLDSAGKLTGFNRAAEGIFRIGSASVLGKPYADVLPAMQGAQLALLVSRLWAQTTQHLVRDVVTQVAGRGEVHLTLHLSGIWHAQEMVGIAIVVEDLTEQARLEIERRAQEQETRRVRDTFEHYVAPTVVEGLLANPQRVALGGERQLVTVLFADIHGFTNLSERLAPEELIEVLNGYLSLAARTLLRYEGTLDKFMGDGVMAMFNAPLPQSDHAWRAACAALALQREVAAYAPQLPEEHRLTFRVGLHTGEAVVGNIGTRELMNYTAIGDTVNIAKRLQENGEGGMILLSRSTHALIEKRVVVRPREKMTVRGRDAPVEIFELIGAWEDKK